MSWQHRVPLLTQPICEGVGLGREPGGTVYCGVTQRNVFSGYHLALGKEEEVIVMIITKAALHLLPGCHL